MTHRERFEKEKGYPKWNCNDTVIMEYIEWLEAELKEAREIIQHFKNLESLWMINTENVKPEHYGELQALCALAEKMNDFLNNQDKEDGNSCIGGNILHSTDWLGKCFNCGKQVFIRKQDQED
jgi:hypothetical protein